MVLRPRHRPTPTLLALLLVGLTTPTFGGPGCDRHAAVAAEDVQVVRVATTSRAQRDLLARTLDAWRIDPADGVVTAAVDGADLTWLRSEGFSAEVDDDATARLRAPRRRSPEGSPGIPGFPCYRTVEERMALVQDLAARHPDLVTLVDIGDSWEKQQGLGGYDLVLLRLTSAAVVGGPGGKPRLMVIGGTHSREYTPVELVTRFAEHLLDRYGTDPDITWILDHHEVHLLLDANPDGRKRAETGLSWRKNADDDFCGGSNDRGIDLNRNYTFRWGCCGGSSTSPCSPIFRGPAGGSEPETAAIMAYVDSIFPDQRGDGLTLPAPDDSTGVLLDVHSFGEDVLWSWGFTTTQPPNGAALYTLGRKYAYFTGYRPQHGSLGTVDGSTKDYAYGELGVPGFTIELGNAFFESCGAFEGTILPDNLDALLYTSKIVRTPYLTPGGPEALLVDVDGDGPVGLAEVGAQVSLGATFDDTRYSSANGVEPTHTIAEAEVRVDVPPWSGSARGSLPMAPADGSFDTSVEGATANLDTAGLAPGRHFLYLRGRDSSGRWGPVTGGFLYLVDPATSPVIRGRVLDAVTGAPLSADIRLGPFRAQAGADGLYSLRVPAGSWDLTAEAPGYGPASFSGVEAQGNRTIVRSFALRPFETALLHDAESGPGGFTADAPWAITSESAQSPVSAWSDSPGGNYGAGLDVSLVAPAVDLTGGGAVELTFWHRFDLESGFDFGHLEVSADGGPFTSVASFDGISGWRQERFSLDLGDAAEARIRFRLETDGALGRDGWYVDDVEVRTLPPQLGGLVFADGFEAGDTAAWSRFPVVLE
ncbi:MAG: M14 family zinc carboxypeptidase [Acidobacteriota bacterium]